MGLFDILKCCIPIFKSRKNARKKRSRSSAASIPGRSYSGAGIKKEPLLSLPPIPQEMREDQDSIPQEEAPKEEIVQTAPQQRSVSAAQDTEPQAAGQEAITVLPQPHQPISFRCDDSGKPQKEIKRPETKVQYLIFENPKPTEESKAVVLAFGNIEGGREKAAELIRNAIKANGDQNVKELLDGLEQCGGSCYISSVNALLFFEHAVQRAFEHEIGHSKQSEQLGVDMAKSLDELNSNGIRAMDLHNILFNENKCIQLEPPEELRKCYLKITLTGGEPFYIRVEYVSEALNGVQKQLTDQQARAVPKSLKAKKNIVGLEANKDAVFYQQIFTGIQKTIEDLEKNQIEEVEFFHDGNWTSIFSKKPFSDNSDVKVFLIKEVLDCQLQFIDEILNDIFKNVSVTSPFNIQSLKRDVEYLQSTKQKLSKRIKKLEGDVERLQSTKKSLSEKLDVERLQSEEKKMDKQLFDLEFKLKMLNQRLSQVRQNLKTKKSEYKSKKKKLEENESVKCALKLQGSWHKIKDELDQADQITGPASPLSPSLPPTSLSGKDVADMAPQQNLPEPPQSPSPPSMAHTGGNEHGHFQPLWLLEPTSVAPQQDGGTDVMGPDARSITDMDLGEKSDMREMDKSPETVLSTASEEPDKPKYGEEDSVTDTEDL
ncbi:hypothetical protein [Caproicibacter fermentans]|uniref:Uncharacterized protein n=1 Tax=Caproicibacter fermentans TaxID=2576756 RepID=A0A7G8TA13_9FIRM|nr:hypothetical protein [Caproicibacter fermentans]QNK40454.1 hypothetical protein HCR03_17700 [Caproicibacter fermentans]